MLQPNRFEVAADLDPMKLYIDGETTEPGQSAQFQDITTRPRLIGDAFGRSFLFERVDNVHAGCFFLNAAQLARVAASPKFGKPNAEFFGPLESAATLMIMLAFDVYKPRAGECRVPRAGASGPALPRAPTVKDIAWTSSCLPSGARRPPIGCGWR